MSKLSRKATVELIDYAQVINPKVPNTASYDEVWDVISEYGGITGNLYTSHNTKRTYTTFEIIKESDGTVLHTLKWKNEDVFENGDWDWTKIFRDVLDCVTTKKLVKRPRRKRAK